MTEIKPKEPERIMPIRERGIFFCYCKDSICVASFENSFAMKKIVVIYFLAFSSQTFSQIHIHGIVVEKISENRISDVQIFFEQDNILVVSDSLGEFSVTLSGYNMFTTSHLAYEGFEYKYEENNLYITMQQKNNLFSNVTITDTRANYFSPITTTNLKASDINKNNFGEDIPQLLQFTPSVVSTSDAGNGIGYTGLRIRGTDATRVNVTINGVPYNDAESQQTYWVDISDIAESADDIQIQRGVGSSQNGISSFGGVIHIYTNQLEEKPFANINMGAGSFQLLKTSVLFGTGRIHQHWFLEGRISKINTDGYIDRAFSDLISFSITSAFKKEKYSSIVNIFSGNEKTYQSWAGVPKDSLQTNRTYNPYTYENQTDNYGQTHYQWHNNFFITKNSNIKLSINYTKGKGYFEQLEDEQYFSAYGVDNFVSDSDTIFSSDIITQKWLDNDFYGAYLQYENEFSDKLNINTGAAAYHYVGEHFGKVIWAQYATPFGINYEWYRNNATKNDYILFSIMQYSLSDNILLYADLQLRNVMYNFLGYDENANAVDQNVKLLFFNPKLGISYAYQNKNMLYFSLAKSGHEPNGDDYTESSPISRPSPEILYNIELGNKLNLNGWQLQTTFYYMYYENQLILTGEINDVGAYTRTNIPVSYRAGIELAVVKTFFSRFLWDANFTISKNKIQEHSEYIDNWDTGWQIENSYYNTTISFSPAVVGSNKFEYIFFHSMNPQNENSRSISAILQSKYVSRQFINNTENVLHSIEPYFIHSVLFNFSFIRKQQTELNSTIGVQNLIDTKYESNAWVYNYIYEGRYQEMNGYFPQAGRNFTIAFRVKF